MLAPCLEALLEPSNQLHVIWIPMNNSATFDTKIAEQRSSGCAVAEHSIFHDRFAGPNGFEEIVEVIVAIAVSRRRHVFFVSRRRLSYWVRERVLLTVGFENLFLHRFSECADGIPRLFLARRATDADRIPGNLHRAL